MLGLCCNTSLATRGLACCLLELQQLVPQVVTGGHPGSTAAAAPAAALLQQQQFSSLAQPQPHQWHLPLQAPSHHRRSYATEPSSKGNSSSSTSTAEQQAPQTLQPAITAQGATPSDLSSKQPAAAAGRHRQLADVEPSGFVTLPPRATASGYPESFIAAQQQQQPGSSSSSSGKVPIQQVQLPQERLRIQLRQEAAGEEAAAEQADAFSIARSLIPGAHSFDTAATSAAAADAAAPPQQQQQAALTASDRELLEKLVGILTKEGKKSRARRLLLDAMHIIKQQVAKGPQA